MRLSRLRLAVRLSRLRLAAYRPIDLSRKKTRARELVLRPIDR